MHQGKWPSKFSEPQDVGSQSRTGFCSCKERDPLLKLVAWHLKLHFLCMEAHKDAHETLSLASSLILCKQGSSPVQEARPREMWLHPSMACHIYPVRIMTDITSIKPFSPPVPYQDIYIYIFPLSPFLLSKQKLALVEGIKKIFLLRI